MTSSAPADAASVWPAAADRDYFWRPLYRPIVGCLLYASVSTRPEIANEVRCLTQHLTNPGPAHWALAVRVLGGAEPGGAPDEAILERPAPCAFGL